MQSIRVLVINPGSTSTKLAYFVDESAVFYGGVEHPEGELRAFTDIASQLPCRLSALDGFLSGKGVGIGDIDAVAARGGLMKPVKSGVYRVNQKMVEDLKNSALRWGREHASNLGAMLAMAVSERYGAPAFTADPVTVDEFDDIARISGVPEISRKSHLHALNIKAMVRRAAGELKLKIADANFVAAHMGGGISVAAVRGGKIIDANNALLGMGPFSPARAGGLPIGDLVDMAFSGGYDRESLIKKLSSRSGLSGYLGTSDVREVEARIDLGDQPARLVYEAMAYQVGKEIAAMASALEGKVNAVILTGGVARSARFISIVKKRVGFIADVLIYPGEAEMEALAYYARAALTGQEKILEYE